MVFKVWTILTKLLPPDFNRIEENIKETKRILEATFLDLYSKLSLAISAINARIVSARNTLLSEISDINDRLDDYQNNPQTFSSLQRFNNGIAFNSTTSEPSIDGKTYNQTFEDPVVNFAEGQLHFSVAAYNAKVLSEDWNTLGYPTDSLDVSPNQPWNSSGEPAFIESGTLYTRYAYAGSVNAKKQIYMAFRGRGRGGYEAAGVVIRVDGTIVHSAEYEAPGSSIGDILEIYFNFPAAATSNLSIRLENPYAVPDPPSPTGTIFTPEVYIRRAPHPVVAGQPIKVYADDYSVTQQRVILYEDWVNNKIG